MAEKRLPSGVRLVHVSEALAPAVSEFYASLQGSNVLMENCSTEDVRQYGGWLCELCASSGSSIVALAPDGVRVIGMSINVEADIAAKADASALPPIPRGHWRMAMRMQRDARARAPRLFKKCKVTYGVYGGVAPDYRGGVLFPAMQEEFRRRLAVDGVKAHWAFTLPRAVAAFARSSHLEMRTENTAQTQQRPGVVSTLADGVRANMGQWADGLVRLPPSLTNAALRVAQAGGIVPREWHIWAVNVKNTTILVYVMKLDELQERPSRL